MVANEFFLASALNSAIFSSVSLSLPPGAAACLLAVAGTLAFGSSSFAASGSWLNVTGTANWSLGSNWGSGNIPGSTDLAVSNADQATFGTAAAVEQPVLDASRRLGRVVISNTSASYNIGTSSGTNVLYLQNTGTASAQLTIIGGGATTIDAHVRLGSANNTATPATWNTGTTALTLSNGLSLAAGTTYWHLTNSNPITVGGTVHTLVTGTLLFQGVGGANITGTIQDGPGVITLQSQSTYTGTVRLSGSNTFVSDVIWRAGTLEISSDNALLTAGTNALQLGSANSGAGATFALTTGAYTVSRQLKVSPNAVNTSITFGGSHTSGTSVYSGSFNLVGRNGGVNLTAAAGGAVEFSGIVSGNSTTQAIITKVGAGVVKLTNANTYTGGTTVSQGTLLINNAAGSGAGTGSVVVNGGALGGTGAFTGTLTVNAGGTLTPGDSTAAVGSQAGTLATGSLIMNGGALAMNISGSTAGDGAGFYDQVIVTGTVSLLSDVNFTLTLDGYNPPDDSTVLFTLVDNNLSDPVGGSGLFNLNGTNQLAQGEVFTVGGQDFQISYTSGGTVGTFLGGGNDIAILAVPEPSSVFLIAGGLALLGWRKRRRL